MMGDAISHAVLPGLAAGFILTGSRGGVTMLVGAALMGLVTTLLTQWLHQFGRDRPWRPPWGWYLPRFSPWG